MGVTSAILLILNPAAFKARTADSRPGPGPLISTSTLPHRANLFFILRRLRQRGNGRVFSSDSLYDVGRLRRLAASSGLSVETVYPLPFSIDRPGEPSVSLLWRTIAAILRLMPTGPTRGAFALVLREGREDPHAPP